MRKIWLSRHGESMYNTLQRLGGDSPLSSRGEVYAHKLPDVLVDRVPLVRTPASANTKVNTPSHLVNTLGWAVRRALSRIGKVLGWYVTV